MSTGFGTEQVLAGILDSTEDAIIGITLDGFVDLWSRGAERLYGYTAAEVKGQSLAQLVPLYELPALEEMLRAAQAGLLRESETVDRLHKQRLSFSVTVRRLALRNAAGEITGILETGRRVSRTVTEAGETRLDLVMDQMPLLVWATDQNLRITSNWGGGPGNTLPRSGEMVGSTVLEYLKSEETNKSVLAHHYAALRGESVQFEYLRRDRTLDIRLEPLRAQSGEIVGCVGVGIDITQRKKTEEHIRYQATHDALTGLSNYREFMDTLERELRRAMRGRHSFTVMLLDLDDLKHINDRLGHLAGNRALKRLAVVMKEQCRSTDLLARYGGDEFAVVLIDSDQRMAEHVAERIETCLRTQGGEPQLSVSIGFAMYPDDGQSAPELLEAADQRLYKRKKSEQVRNVSIGEG